MGSARGPLFLGAFLAWLAGVAGSLRAEPLTLDTPRFQAQAGLGDLVSLRNAAGVVLVTNPASSHGVVLHRIENEHRARLDSGPVVWHGTGAVERVLTNFTGLPGATARCRYGVDSLSGDLLISQTCTSPAPGVWGVQWSIANIPLEYNIVVPGFSGVKLTRSSGGGLTTQSIDYPMSWEAQLVVVEGEGHGFYVWSDDPEARFKRLTVLRTTQGWQLGFISINHAPFDGLRQCDSVSWRLNTYEGDWRAPARRYREWLAGAFALTSIEQQQPAWVRDIRCCVIMGTDVALLEGLHQRLAPSQSLLYVYDWRASGYDRGYPTYDNPVPRLAEFVERAHALGYRVMLHVNYFGCDPLHPLYPQFEPYQVRSPWGTHEREWWIWEAADPPIKFAYINPAHAGWRRLFVERMRTLCESTRVDALHLDQTLCIYNDHNGLIEGMTMAEGNLALHRELRAALPQVALSGEGLNEVTFQHESFAQRHASAGIAQSPQGMRVNRAGLEISHPISSFLFRPYTILYGYLGDPDPADGQLYAAWNEAYQHWGIIPTLKSHRQDYAHVAEFTRQFFDEAAVFQQQRLDPDLDATWPATVCFPFKTADGEPCFRTVDRRLMCADREISRTITDQAEVDLPGLIPGASQYDGQRVWGLNPERWYPYFPERRDLGRLHLEQIPAGYAEAAATETAGMAQVVIPAPSDVAVDLLARLDTAICRSAPAGAAALEVIGPLNGPHGSQFFRDGEKIVAHPPWRTGVGSVSARYEIDLPSDETLRFESAVALDPGAVGPGRSDGVTFSVTALGQGRSLSNVIHTASAEPQALDLEVGALAGQRVMITLHAHPGPAQNPSYDWARWHQPRIRRSPRSSEAEVMLVSSNRWSLALSGTREIDLAGLTNRYPVRTSLPGQLVLLRDEPGGLTLPSSLAALSFHTFFFLDPNLPVRDALYAGAQWRDGTVGGQTRSGLFMHPPNGGRTEAVFALRLPPQPALFQASVGIGDGSQSEDAWFLVKVNGTEVGRMRKTPGSWSDLAIDLAPWRGRVIALALVVDSAGDYSYDWCNWGTPQLRFSPRLGQPLWRAGGRVDLQLVDGIGLRWRLERSSDLSNWISLLQTNPVSSPVTLTDVSPGQSSYYRTAWP